MCNELLNRTNIMKEVVTKSVLLLNNKDVICQHTTFLVTDPKQLHALATQSNKHQSLYIRKYKKKII
jgi:hypothetical protein